MPLRDMYLSTSPYNATGVTSVGAMESRGSVALSSLPETGKMPAGKIVEVDVVLSHVQPSFFSTKALQTVRSLLNHGISEHQLVSHCAGRRGSLGVALSRAPSLYAKAPLRAALHPVAAPHLWPCSWTYSPQDTILSTC